MSAAADDALDGTLPLHRAEALTDGIYAVAMTLLVIELKLPDGAAHASGQVFLQALADLLPKVIAWILSFFVLALFWVANHRVFAFLRRTDAKLVALNLLQLAFVSLMPFSSALIGESDAAPLLGQALYSAEMTLLAISALLITRYVHHHPELAIRPMPRARYVGACVRIGGIVVISIVAVAITATLHWPGSGNMAFMLMIVINPLSRSFEMRQLQAEAAAASAAVVTASAAPSATSTSA